MTDYLLLMFLINLAKLLAIFVGVCAIGWLLLTIKEWKDKLMERYLPQYYYYDWNDEEM